MKALFAGFCVIVVAILAVRFWAANYRYSASANLMPGQTLQLMNDAPIDIAVSTEYPVSISGTGCQVGRTASAHVYCGAGEIQIVDSRPRLLIWGHSNHVTYSVHRYLVDAITEPSPQQTHLNPTTPSWVPERAMPLGTTGNTEPINPTLRPGIYNLGAESEIRFADVNYRHIRISSDSPISAAAGDCRDVYTFILDCENVHGEVAVKNITEAPASVLISALN